MTAIVVGVLAALLLTLWLVAPGRIDAAKKQPFQNRNFAHRGLHNQDTSVPENSLAAFKAAGEAGYGVELDVQLSRDGQVVVFHDDELGRVCGVEGNVGDYDWAQLKEMQLCGTDETIPLFTEVLEVLSGAPVIVELKTSSRNDELCERTLAILRANTGHCCVESFDPFIVGWFRKHAPEILRGQLSNPPKYFDTLPKWQALLLGNMLANCVSRPHFVAYDTSPRPMAVKLCMALHPMSVVWTVHPEDDPPRLERENDAVIFEFYRPEAQYSRK